MAKRSLKRFIQFLWHTVETDPFVDGWHIDVVCEHLEAAYRGDVKKLLINVPPRHMKSLSVSVFFPMWVWLQGEHGASRRFMYASYSDQLSTRDSVKSRRVFNSAEYQRLLSLFNPDLVLVGDQNQKTRFENNFHGYRVATTVGGMGTGEGGDFLCIDDPHNIKDVESDKKRKSVLEWWDEVMPTRVSNFKTAAKIAIMQRSHEQDLSGHILEKDTDWDHICLPARFEGYQEDRNSTRLGFRDPRLEIGEALWADHIGVKELDEIEKEMSDYAIAGQMQQRPAPRKGGLFKVGGLITVEEYNERWVTGAVRYWDKAGTEDGGAYTSGVLMLELAKGPFRYLIADVVRGQWGYEAREPEILLTAHTDGREVPIWIEQEPGSGGKESALRTVKMLAGYDVHADPVGGNSGNKEKRAGPLAAQVKIGNVAILKRPWNKAFVKEMRFFPRGKYKDQIDSAAGAFNKLTKLGIEEKFAGTWGRNRRKNPRPETEPRSKRSQERRRRHGLMRAIARRK